MNYEEMSDNELNMMVADLRGGYAGNVHGSESMVKLSDPESCGLFYMEVDYCNNPSDAWPIIETIWSELSSVVMFDDGIGFGERHMTMWDAQSNMMSCGKLRAAMIVFLKLKETV